LEILTGVCVCARARVGGGGVHARTQGNTQRHVQELLVLLH